ncbi:MAG: hypothetical protein IKP21_03575 [Bacteroidales bacterium]|nr:hypothetical protein [Bacteroidales bacterium]
MKKSIILFLAIVATMSLSAQKYALHFGSTDAPVVVAGDTVEYTTTDIDMNVMHMAYLYIYIENLTDSNLVTDNDYEVLEGPADLETEVCAGGNCPQQGEYTLVPGDNPDMPFTLEPHLKPEYGGQHILYRVTVGEGRNLENGVTVYIRVNITANSGINSADNAEAVKVYPNPTRGKVTVGDKEYDLSGRSAGVYYLPVEGGSARVIKL